MSANFFQKRIWRGICSFCVLFVAIFLGVAVHLSTMEEVVRAKSFYFLLSTDTNVEVGVEFVQWEGGAGYLLDYDGREYAVLSVYEREEDGKRIQTVLQNRGRETLLIKVGGNVLSGHDFESLRMMESYISFLNQCISKLEKGMTQESCRRTLRILVKQLIYIEKNTEDTEVSKVFRQSREALSDIIKKDIFVKDLRYVLCFMVDNYIQIAVTLG